MNSNEPNKTTRDYFLPPKAPTPPDPFRPLTPERNAFPCGKNEPSTATTETGPEPKAR
jgi:hypothetical protein